MSVFLQITSLLLIACTLLLLWGCSTRPVSVPMVDMDEAPLLATVKMPLPFASAQTDQLSSQPVFSATPALALPSAEAHGLLILPPHCYRQAQRGLICLGNVINTGLEAVENLFLRLQLGSAAQTVALEQRVIPPGKAAPYRAIFPQMVDDSATTALLDLQRRPLDMPPLTVIEQNGNYTPGRAGYGHYRYEALLRAEADYAPAWQAIVTLYSSSQQVVGYRVLEYDPGLTAGQIVQLQTSIIPLVVDAQYSAVLTISPR
jgi:hypothetical protein